MEFENFIDESLVTLLVFLGYFVSVCLTRIWLKGPSQIYVLFVIHIASYLGFNDSELYSEAFWWSFAIGVLQISSLYLLLAWNSGRKKIGYLSILAPILLILTFRGFEVWELLGISFVAIRISFLAFEVTYREEKLPNFFQYWNYLFFLPTLLMGPVNPYSSFRSSLEADHKICFTVDHLWKFFHGFIKFFIFTPFVSSLGYGYLEGVDEHHYPLGVLLSTGFFSYLTIYFQFSGFCDMMVSYGKCLGFEMKENFISPLLSRNPQDHWRRWHVSLMEYFREVFFYPLFLKLQQSLKNRFILPTAIFCTFVIFLGIGFWHGAGPKYVLFGAYHALGVSWILIYDKFLERFLGKDGVVAYQQSPWVAGLARLLTLLYLSFGYLLYFYGLKMFVA